MDNQTKNRYKEQFQRGAQQFKESVQSVDTTKVREGLASASGILGDGLKKMSDLLNTETPQQRRQKELYALKRLRSSEQKVRSQKPLSIVVMVLGALGMLAEIADRNIWNIPTFAALLLFGVFLYERQQKLTSRYQRFHRYQTFFDEKEQVSIGVLKQSLHLEEQMIIEDFNAYISQGILRQGHVDLEDQRIYLSHDAYQRSDLPTPPGKKTTVEPTETLPEEVQSFVEEVNAMIARVEIYNVDIEDEEVSKELDDLVVAIRKIRDLIKKHPESLSKTDRMMKYYLPMTMKLLDKYCELDDDQNPGKYIQSSKEEIEKILTTLNDGFDQLYDEMYQNTSMDIHSDVSVLETLLAQDGLIKEKKK